MHGSRSAAESPTPIMLGNPEVLLFLMILQDVSCLWKNNRDPKHNEICEYNLELGAQTFSCR